MICPSTEHGVPVDELVLVEVDDDRPASGEMDVLVVVWVSLLDVSVDVIVTVVVERFWTAPPLVDPSTDVSDAPPSHDDRMMVRTAARLIVFMEYLIDTMLCKVHKPVKRGSTRFDQMDGKWNPDELTSQVPIVGPRKIAMVAMAELPSTRGTGNSHT
jgi:hypothetical protein